MERNSREVLKSWEEKERSVMVHSVFYNIQKLTSLEEPSLFLRFAISFSLNPNVTVSKRFKKYAILNYLVNRNRKCQ